MFVSILFLTHGRSYFLFKMIFSKTERRVLMLHRLSSASSPSSKHLCWTDSPYIRNETLHVCDWNPPKSPQTSRRVCFFSISVSPSPPSPNPGVDSCDSGLKVNVSPSCVVRCVRGQVFPCWDMAVCTACCCPAGGVSDRLTFTGAGIKTPPLGFQKKKPPLSNNMWTCV